MKKKRYDRIERLCLEIKMYNKIHNTHYSYGQYKALVRSGKIISEVLSERNEKNENQESV